MLIQTEERIHINFDLGKARTCNHCGEVFGTRKGLRVHRKELQQPRERKRPYKKARRAKAIRD